MDILVIHEEQKGILRGVVKASRQYDGGRRPSMDHFFL